MRRRNLLLGPERHGKLSVTSTCHRLTVVLTQLVVWSLLLGCGAQDEIVSGPVAETGDSHLDALAVDAASADGAWDADSVATDVSEDSTVVAPDSFDVLSNLDATGGQDAAGDDLVQTDTAASIADAWDVIASDIDTPDVNDSDVANGAAQDAATEDTHDATSIPDSMGLKDIMVSDGLSDTSADTTQQACKNNKDCPGQLLCDKVKGLCVVCNTDGDCPAKQGCWQGLCVTQTPCKSDVTCVPQGLLCDKAKGFCVACLIDADCSPDAYCASGAFGGGACLADSCLQGSSRCEGNILIRCNKAGSAYLSPTLCPTQNPCKETSKTSALCGG